MGRHSRGSGEGIPPSPLPDPPARHPYAPPSAEDTGGWDRRTYPVVDVGLPPVVPGPAGSPAAPASFPLDGSARTSLRSVRPAEAPSRYGSVDGARTADPEPRYGATRADLAPGGFRPDRNPHAFPPPTPDPRLAAPRPEPTGSRSGASRPEPAESRFGATRADLVEPRLGAPRLDQAGSRFGVNRADLVESGFAAPLPEPAGSRFGATRADLVEPGFGAAGFGGRRPDPAESPGRVDRAEPGRPDAAEPRFGATRADLAESVGSTALARRPARTPDPDEVTDTGARRARSAFRLAETAAETAGDDHGDEHREPSLLLQWGIFIAQTLTGAIAGLGVWLGFYRLWSTWPFYAVPAVGVAAIGMLVLARTLRRRHGHDLDLLTAIVTVVIITVLTVLPAAFTLPEVG